MSSETQLSRAVQVALESIGCIVVRVQAGELCGAGGHHVQGAMAGTPDLYVIGPSIVGTVTRVDPAKRMFTVDSAGPRESWNGWLELKLPGGVLSSHQQAWRDLAKSRGVRVETVRSVEQALRVVTGRAA
jgi:hypothetical protein